jgi:hypothetical protein
MHNKMRALLVAAIACIAIAVPAASAQATPLYSGNNVVPTGTAMTMTNTNGLKIVNDLSAPIVDCTGASFSGTYTGIKQNLGFGVEVRYVSSINLTGAGQNGNCVSKYAGNDVRVAIATKDPQGLCFGTAYSTQWSVYSCGDWYPVLLRIQNGPGSNYCYYNASSPSSSGSTLAWNFSANPGSEPWLVTGSSTRWKAPATEGCFNPGTGGLRIVAGDSQLPQQFVVKTAAGANVHMK